jgi:hypothetical protein
MFSPSPTRYGPPTTLPRGKTTNPIPKNQMANPEGTGVDTRLEITPITAIAKAIRRITCFEAQTFLALVLQDAKRHLRGPVAIRLIRENLSVFVLTNRSLSHSAQMPEAAGVPGSRTPLNDSTQAAGQGVTLLGAIIGRIAWAAISEKRRALATPLEAHFRPSHLPWNAQVATRERMAHQVPEREVAPLDHEARSPSGVLRGNEKEPEHSNWRN